MSDELHVSHSGGAYVLGALTPEEANEIETHAATCEQCREEIENLKHVVSVLPLACASVDPSPDLKSRIVAAGAGGGQAGALVRSAKAFARVAASEVVQAPANAPASDAYSVYPVGAEQLHSRVTVTHESKV